MDTGRQKWQLQKCRTLFTQGSYRNCIEKLTEITPKQFSGLSLILEHNIAVCRHLTQGTSTCSSGKLELEDDRGQTAIRHTYHHNELEIQRETLIALKKLLVKLQGLPPSGVVLEVECAAVYNLCHIQILKEGHENVHSLERTAFLKSVINCLRRVCIDVRQTTKQFAAPEEYNHNQFIKLALCIINIKLPERIESTVGPVILSYALYLLITDEALDTKIIDLLESFYVFSREWKQPLVNLYTFAITRNPGTELDLHVKDVCVLTLCGALYKNKKFHRCVEVINERKCDASSTTITYVKGCALFQLEKYEDCLSCLKQILDVEQTQLPLGMTLNLAGCCLSKQGHFESSIQYFQRCLLHDFSDACALYNLACQYRRLERLELELKTLNLLLGVLEKEKPNNQEKMLRVDVGSLCVQQVTPIKSLERAEVLFLVAERYAELNRFEEAAEHYLDLISLSMSGTVKKFIPRGLKALPDPVTVFHRAAHALTQCGRYSDAIVVCDQVLNNQNPLGDSAASQSQLTDSESQGLSCSQGSPRPSLSHGRKRARSPSPDSQVSEPTEDGWWKTFPDDVIALKYKADALHRSGEQDQALVCLERIAALIENEISTARDVPHEEPATKRLRRGSDFEDKKDDNLVTFFIDVYIARAIVQNQLGKMNCALESSQRAVDMKKESELAVFTHCVMLLHHSRPDDASRLWTRLRQMDIRHMDSMYLDRLLQKKLNQTRNIPTSLPSISPTEPSAQEKILLDILCLQHAQKQSLRKRTFFYK